MIDLKTFSKLWAKDEDLEVIIKSISDFTKMKKLVSKALDFSHKHKTKNKFQKRLKGKKVVD